MGTLARRTSSIHKVREFPLPKVDLFSEYDVLQTLGQGWFAKVLLTEHRRTRAEVVLKAISKDGTSRREFFREFHYSYYLSPHPSVLKTYDVAFESERFFYFAQELAPFGDLTSNVGEAGLGEVYTKRVISQIASALEFIHSKDLVHRDLKMDNVLVFTSDFSVVKLTDFGSTRKAGTLVRRRHELLPYCPPEVAEAVYNEGYHVSSGQDVWQLGIMLYVLLTGALPWQKADETTDKLYAPYYAWQQRRTSKVPPKFKEFTTRLQRLFRRTLDPKEETRVSVKEFFKYSEDKWLARRSSTWIMSGFRTTGILGSTAANSSENRMGHDCHHQGVLLNGRPGPATSALNHSLQSLHSCIEEKNRIFQTLTQYGIETVVDRSAKKERIRDWIQSSCIYRNHQQAESSSAVVTSRPVITVDSSFQ